MFSKEVENIIELVDRTIQKKITHRNNKYRLKNFHFKERR